MADAGSDAATQLAHAQLAHANDLYRAKKYPEAEAACRDILHRDPCHGGAWERLAHIATSTERPLEAVAFYEEAIRHLAHPAEAHNNLAVALHQRGDLQAALEHYRRAIALGLSHGLLHSNFGCLLRDLGHLEDAVGQLRRALEIDPLLAHAHSNLGVVFCLQARADLA
ncbi:MAG TPA: tetratricopeptide repeat protein, partial [Polyangia bacterium]|nr:tetratricopeptide repeat protein [Polyangia bacterium]